MTAAQISAAQITARSSDFGYSLAGILVAILTATLLGAYAYAWVAYPGETFSWTLAVLITGWVLKHWRLVLLAIVLGSFASH